MKVLYIESRLKNQFFKLKNSEIAKLPKKLFLAYSVQYKELAGRIKNKLQANNIKITGFQQVLGCSKVNAKDSILLIGTGRFHSLNLYLQSSAIYIIERNKVKQIPAEDIESLKNTRKTALIKYLKANNIGILVSTKPGQEQLDKAIKLKKQLKSKRKQAFIFLSNNIDINQLENFNIDSWVNTACLGLSYDNPNIINYDEIKV